MGGLSFHTDPVTDDLVDSDDGFFVEVADASPAVYCQVKHEYARWPGDENAGSLIYALSEMGVDESSRQFLETELLRAYGVLADEGMIGDTRAQAQEGEPGQLLAQASYRDATTGDVVDDFIAPAGA